jgi:hypothetical protein
MTTPWRTQTRKNMALLIGAMTIEDGYNFDWGAINNRNYAIGNFPRAEIYCSEENFDEEAGRGCQDYTNKTMFVIKVAGKLTTSSANPLFEIDDVFDLAVDDLIKLFGNNNSVNDTCDFIQYKGFTRSEKSGSGDQFIPSKMDVKFVATYAIDRLDPTLYSSA